MSAKEGEQDQATGETGAAQRTRVLGWQQSPRHYADIDQANLAGERAVADKFVVGKFAANVGRSSYANFTSQSADPIDAEQFQSKNDDPGNCHVLIFAKSIGIGDDAPERDLQQDELAPVHPAVVPIGANAMGHKELESSKQFWTFYIAIIIMFAFGGTLLRTSNALDKSMTYEEGATTGGTAIGDLFVNYNVHDECTAFYAVSRETDEQLMELFKFELTDKSTLFAVGGDYNSDNMLINHHGMQDLTTETIFLQDYRCSSEG